MLYAANQVFDFNSDGEAFLHEEDFEVGNEDDDEDPGSVYSEELYIEGSEDDSSSHESIVNDDTSEGEEEYDIDSPAKGSRTTTKQKASTKKKLEKSAASGAFKDQPLTLQKFGLDENVPPLSNCDEIFNDLTARAVSLGFDKVVKSLKGRKFRVGTMFSGTESPILAIQQINRALVHLGLPSFEIDHLFSFEIEPFKQAYIARNFDPPKIFRDALDLCKPNAMEEGATTVYGSKVPVDGDLDLLIAGFVCKDFSTMNRSRKTLEEQGESGDTFRALYEYARRWRSKIIIIENVEGAPWLEIQAKFEQIGYVCSFSKADTKSHYLPQTRSRGYIMAFDHKQSPVSTEILKASIDRYPELLKALRRPASASVGEFLLSDDDTRVQFYKAQSSHQLEEQQKEMPWELCKARHASCRQDWGLGKNSPFTNWDIGPAKVPSYADAAWHRVQRPRVLDLLEISILRNAHPDRGAYDSMYKQRIWDLSQNVNHGMEDKGPFGIAGCLTPRGMQYLSSRGGPLIGYELLALQGIPINDIVFTTESDADLKNLAGNAMSTTVVGTAIIIALMLSKGLLATSPQSPGKSSKSKEDKYGMTTPNMISETVNLSCSAISSKDIIHDAIRSSRLCFCEGQTRVNHAKIYRCSCCSHTVCEKCYSKPRHSDLIQVDDNTIESRFMPQHFIQKWHSILPLTIRLSSVPNADNLLNLGGARFKEGDLGSSEYWNIVAHTFTKEVHLQGGKPFERAAKWTITYESTDSRLVLELNQHAEAKKQVRWLLYAKPAATLPAKSVLRKVLQFPIAQCYAPKELLKGRWQVFLPQKQKRSLFIRPVGTERTPSWSATIGIVPCEHETVPMRLEITGMEDDVKILHGTYVHLPECGTASSSLYKQENVNRGELPLYCFLDPTPTGAPHQDAFVFAYNHERLEHGRRDVHATLDSSWRPWDMHKKMNVTCSTNGRWVDLDATTVMKSVARGISISKPKSWEQSLQLHACSESLAFLRCNFQADMVFTSELARLSDKKRVQDTFLERYAWLIRRTVSNHELQKWQTIENLPEEFCSTCSPSRPGLQWSKQKKGNRTLLLPFEDRPQAAVYEKALKRRPDVFSINIAFDGTTSVTFGLNIHALAHRAIGSISHVIGTSTNVSWRLKTEIQSDGFPDLPAFSVPNNDANNPESCRVNLLLPLLEQQKKSVVWMTAREESDETFPVEEVHEFTLPYLQWTAEARASRSVNIRGGILADEVAYGKTVVSLALIHSEFERKGKAHILKECKASQQPLGELPLAATLVLCPKEICLQWKTETLKFLPRSMYGKKGDVLVITSPVDWMRTTIKDFVDAKIIIAPWNLFGHDKYINALASFSALPPPFDTSNARAFTEWLNYSLKEVPSSLSNLQAEGVKLFNQNGPQRLADNMLRKEFESQIPSNCLTGQAYTKKRRLEAELEIKAMTGKPNKQVKNSRH